MCRAEAILCILRRFTAFWKNPENRHGRKSSIQNGFRQLPMNGDTCFRASGEKTGMPSRKMHLMTRLSVLFFCTTVLLAPTITSLRAAPPDSPGDVRTAYGEAPLPSSFSDI